MPAVIRLLYLEASVGTGAPRVATAMTATSEDYVEFVKDQLDEIPGIESSRLFGGVGLSVGGIQFAMLMGNTLYFAVDDETRPRYEAMGSECFWYTKKDRRVDVRKYYDVPAEMLEDRERLVALAEEAIQVARTAKKGK